MDNNKSGSHNIKFKGLSSAEVIASREKHGANIMTPPEREPWWKLYLEKFSDPIIRILIVAAIIAIGAGIVDGKYFEGIGIIIAILLATTLAFINEYKANQEFDILNKVNDDILVKVIRDGIYSTVPRKDIVVNDIVILEVGEEIPCDGEVLEAVSFQIDESKLTGESVPVSKFDKDTLAQKTQTKESAYSADKLLSGTMVMDGHGIMEVTAVGDSTEIGKTARAAAEETGEETPLNKQLDKLSKLIGVAAFFIAGLIYIALVIRGVIVGELNLSSGQWYFTIILMISALLLLIRVWMPILYDSFELMGKDVEKPQWLENDNWVEWIKSIGVGIGVFALGIGIGYVTGLLPQSPEPWLPADAGHDFLTYFMIAVTIIVVAVPEGLPMSVTLSLAYSMRKMTASNNLVRRMHACETIGAATVICTDKTGTLTMNEMRVHEPNFPVMNNSTLNPLIIEAISANTTANLHKVSGEETRAIGNPTEGALLLWLDQNGVDYIYHRTDFQVAYQLTFSTERKYMATLGSSSDAKNNILHVKGAPEIVMDKCGEILTAQGLEPIETHKDKIKESLKNYQARGMRTLGFAYKEVPKDKEVNIEELTENLIWLGFVAIADPVRPEVPSAIQMCQDAGIKVKIVTGDNPYTAQEIASQIGLWNKGDETSECKHMTGPDFSKLDDAPAIKCAGDLKILSRARPMDKMRLVKLLQENGEVVAVTGDGTNDAPALNYANVGLAMGKTGTSVAKEASDIILLDDSFRSIVNAVMWGRSLYQNIQRFILFQLTINVAALVIALLGPFIGIKLPFTVVQMLWVNLIMDTFAALALATEPPHWGVMKNPPRDPEDFILTKSMMKNILTVATIFIIFLVGFLFYLQKDGPINLDVPADVYKLSVFFSVFVMLQIWNLFNARCLGLTTSAFHRLFENKGFIIIFSIIFIGQILMVQFGGNIFRTVPLSLTHWLIIIAGTSVVLWVGELSRLFSRLKKTA